MKSLCPLDHLAPASVRTLAAKRAGFRGAAAALGLMGAALSSPSHAQAPPLGTAATFGVLAGTTVTNTNTPTIISGNVGVSPGSAVTGFPPGIVVGGTIHAGDAVALQAQSDDVIAYLNLAGRPVTQDLTGQDLGGKTLIAGVYGYTSSAQLTGTLTLDGQGNPNSVFIIKIGSTLTTASASSILLINGAQGGNVFFQVGSSAVLGTGTSFTGDILALTSITLTSGANIFCGDALAQNGAVTLDNNHITICQVAAATASSVLPSSAPSNQRAVANAIDTFVANGGTLPPAFQNLLSFLSPSQLANAFSQLSGEAGTGAAQAGTQAMNSFLSLVTNPFAENRSFAPERPSRPRPMIYKAPVYKAAAPDPRRWSIWAAGYGGQSNTTGDPVLVGSHDRSARTVGFATGIDYRVTPYTVAGFALGGGRTSYGLSGGFGGGRSDMLQAAVYSVTRVEAAYVSAAVAYAWHRVSTERFLTVAGTDDLTAQFSANNVGGRIEGGYRFAIPGVFSLPGFGFTPYAAFQAQAFRTPSYSEIAASGSSAFALAYSAQTTTTTRTELGAWFDRTIALDNGAVLALRSRNAWAHDHWSDPSITATFQSLPGSSFTVFGAAPARDSWLSSAGAEIGFRNGISLAAWFDSELAKRSQTYTGTARLRYTW
jgi:uncharacterized protein with beta-barrel porin domain